MLAYHDLHTRVGPGILDGAARVAVDAGAGAVDDRDGDVPPDEAHSLQHGPLSPTVGDGHVLEGRLATAVRVRSRKNRAKFP